MELCFLPAIYLGPNYGGGNEDNGDLFQKVMYCYAQYHACTATLSALNPAAGHRQPMPPLETPGHSQASLRLSLVGSLLLSRGSYYTQGSVCALQESVSQSCVSSGRSMMGLMLTSSKRAYAIPKSAAPKPLSLWQSAADPYLHRRCSNTLLAQSLWDPWILVHTRFVWGPWASLVRMGFYCRYEFSPPTIMLRLLFCPWMGVPLLTDINLFIYEIVFPS